mgnify:CR=1 FL=1
MREPGGAPVRAAVVEPECAASGARNSAAMSSSVRRPPRDGARCRRTCSTPPPDSDPSRRRLVATNATAAATPEREPLQRVPEVALGPKPIDGRHTRSYPSGRSSSSSTDARGNALPERLFEIRHGRKQQHARPAFVARDASVADSGCRAPAACRADRARRGIHRRPRRRAGDRVSGPWAPSRRSTSTMPWPSARSSGVNTR